MSTAQVIELVSPNETSQPSGRYGAAVKGLSDLTGDGIGELAVITTETIPGVAALGSVYILNGHDFSVVRRLISPEPALSGNFGAPQPFLPDHIAQSPDLNGDNVPELIVPALPDDATQPDTTSSTSFASTFERFTACSMAWPSISMFDVLLNPPRAAFASPVRA